MSTHSSSKFFSTWAKEKRQFRNLEVKPIGLNHVSLKGTTAACHREQACQITTSHDQALIVNLNIMGLFSTLKEAMNNYFYIQLA